MSQVTQRNETKVSLQKAELRLRIAMQRARIQAEAPAWRNAADCVDTGVSAARTARILGKMLFGKGGDESASPRADSGSGFKLEQWFETALAGWRLWEQISKLITKRG